MGIMIYYPGWRLYELREAFIHEAQKSLDWQVPDPLPDETDGNEVYMDTLYVKPEHRGKGVGGQLLMHATRLAQDTYGKPCGLLVPKQNAKARRLYESLGYKYVGERFFFDEMMDHLVK